MKKAEEISRHTSRQKNLARAKECDKRGDSNGARNFYNKAVDVTPEMNRAFKDKLVELEIAFVVAPYEADSQLAYLATTEPPIIDIVVTEDSDLLAYACPVVFFKFDRDTCMGDQIVYRELGGCDELDLVNWDETKFIHMCVLAGCDYIDSLPSVGMTRANKMIRRHMNLTRLWQSIRFEGKIRIPTDYIQKFERAVDTFLHARVWCPRLEQIVHMSHIHVQAILAKKK